VALYFYIHLHSSNSTAKVKKNKQTNKHIQRKYKNSNEEHTNSDIKQLGYIANFTNFNDHDLAYTGST